ncbi:MAG: flagellar basal body rod protein FlgC [Oscillospiraceae bacterium]|nr:flagellar basal body rod protein FlgC [Oscillospiraceae bacterium]
MGFFKSMDLSASALSAQRFRMDVISQNVANEDTTRTANGEPYRRRVVVFEEKNQQIMFSDWLARFKSTSSLESGNGVRAVRVEEDMTSDFKMVYDPEHPDAGDDGYVRYPNVDRERELTDMMAAVRSYEANVTALNNFKNIAMKALEI